MDRVDFRTFFCVKKYQKVSHDCLDWPNNLLLEKNLQFLSNQAQAHTEAIECIEKLVILTKFHIFIIIEQKLYFFTRRLFLIIMTHPLVDYKRNSGMF